MIKPFECELNLPVELSNGILSTTGKVWEVLLASVHGKLDLVKQLENECPELLYAQYNYAPPIHFAVREGHFHLVSYLLDRGAHDPSYRFYPFLDSLQTVARDRGYSEIADLLDEYEADESKHRFKGDNGRIFYNRSKEQIEFEKAVDQNDLTTVQRLLTIYPEFALDQTYFWSEGILMRPAKENRREMIELLMNFGAKVPDILKWTQFYYFERYDGAEFMMQRGMNPNVQSWQKVTILHDMAQKGFVDKAKLLIDHVAALDPIDEAYQSTPLGLAVRWGQQEMVEYLITIGADVNKAGAPWAKPLAWAKSKGHLAIEKLLIRAGAI